MERYRLLDILRGVAILGVVWTHVGATYFTGDQIYIPLDGWRLYPFIFNNGWLGVNAFFVASGFVLFNPRLLQRFETGKYYRARALRLWPLYVCAITVMAIADHMTTGKYFVTLAALLSGLHDLVPAYWMPGDFLYVLWSLGIEILFSLALPLLVLLMRWRGVWPVVLAGIALPLLYRIGADQLWFQSHPEWPNRAINPLADNIFGRIDDFMIGMAASYLYHSGIRPTRRHIVLAALAMFAALYGATALVVSERTMAMSVCASLVHPLFAGALGVFLLAAMDASLWRARMFAPLAVTGQLCYSLYIIHAMLPKYFGDYPKPWDAPALLAYLAAIFSLSALSFVFIECLGIRHRPRWAAWVWRAIERRTSARDSALRRQAEPLP